MSRASSKESVKANETKAPVVKRAKTPPPPKAKGRRTNELDRQRSLKAEREARTTAPKVVTKRNRKMPVNVEQVDTKENSSSSENTEGVGAPVKETDLSSEVDGSNMSELSSDSLDIVRDASLADEAETTMPGKLSGVEPANDLPSSVENVKENMSGKTRTQIAIPDVEKFSARNDSTDMSELSDGSSDVFTDGDYEVYDDAYLSDAESPAEKKIQTT